MSGTIISPEEVQRVREEQGIQVDSKLLVQGAIAQLATDPGAVFEPEIIEAVRQIRGEDPAEYARIRQSVKASKVVQIAEFDSITVASRGDAKDKAAVELFQPVEPWPQPVEGAALLDDISTTILRFIVADIDTIHAASLWMVMTWLVDQIRVCPIANITAPEKRCGKSELLTILGKLSRRPLQVSGVSPAALFRCIELFKPSLLIDEVDAFLAENEEARGILNAGFTRDSAFIIRCVGDDHTPTPFNIWGAKALCGIGKIQSTLQDRSIPLRLRRKKPGEKVERQGHSDPAMWEQLRSKIARFADDVAPQIQAGRPPVIEGLNDRANDCWEPLLAIAEVAGGHWPKLARKAAVTLHGIEEETPSAAIELLGGIKAIFEDRDVNKIFTAHLLEALTEDDEQPWATWNRGKPITPRQLASKLSDFGIKSKQLRIGSVTGKKGFDQNDFVDAWNRYLSPNPPEKKVYALQPSDDGACSDFFGSTDSRHVEHKKTLQATGDAGCRPVADKYPLSDEETENQWGNKL